MKRNPCQRILPCIIPSNTSIIRFSSRTLICKEQNKDANKLSPPTVQGKMNAQDRIEEEANRLIEHRLKKKDRFRSILASRDESYSLNDSGKESSTTLRKITLAPFTKSIYIRDKCVSRDVNISLQGLCSMIMDSELQYIYSSPGERKVAVGSEVLYSNSRDDMEQVQ